jgi:hypothetical protein
MCWRRSSKEWRQAVIEFIKAHLLFVTFCVIAGIYAIAFILCLLQAAKDDYED